MKFKKLFIGCLLTLTFIFCGYQSSNFVLKKQVVFADAKGEWKQSKDGRWWFEYSSGGYAVGWEIIGGKWYHFDSSGWMETGWLELEGKRYYLNDSGAMETGWLELGGKWYYLDSSGAMHTGWLFLGNKIYYLFGSGEMAIGTTIIDKNEFFFDGDGELSQNNKAWSVGTFYNDKYNVDTTEDAIYSSIFYKKLGYDSEYSITPTYSRLNSNASNNMPRLSSAIQLYSGHGSEKGMVFRYNKKNGEYKTGIRVDYDSGDSEYSYLKLQHSDMKNVKLIIFAGCETAKGGYNIASEARKKGASVSIGWFTSISGKSHSLWLYKFNECLSEYNSIKDAILYADSFSYDDSRVKNHYVYGDPYGSLGLGVCYNSKETLYKSNNRQKIQSNNINRYDEIKKINSKFNKYDYKEEVIENENGKYYELYKLKDGAKTGSCYVVYENNGEIKIYENNIKFGITEENTLNKTTLSNIERILSTKFSGKTKVVKTEMIYQDGTFYKRHFVENVIDGEYKTGFDIYEKQ